MVWSYPQVDMHRHSVMPVSRRVTYSYSFYGRIETRFYFVAKRVRSPGPEKRARKLSWVDRVELHNPMKSEQPKHD